MVLSADRVKRGWTSLSENPTISTIVKGTEATQSFTKKQSAGITRTMLRLIVNRYDKKLVEKTNSIYGIARFRIGLESCAQSRGQERGLSSQTVVRH